MYRWLYWVDQNSPKIQRMSMDGLERQIIHDTGLSLPIITLDYDAQVLYWADYNRHRIEKSDVNGTNRQVVTSPSIYYPNAIAYFNGTLYVARRYSQIYSFSSSQYMSYSYISQYYSNIYGIKAIADERQPQSELE